MDFHGLPVQDIRGKLPRNPNGNPRQRRPLSAITGIAVHWDAEERPDAYNSLARYVAQANYHIQKDWGNGLRGDGLMYHFKIDNAGGIFWTRDLEDVLYAVKDGNESHLSICLDCGEGQKPTREQAEALQKLLDELCFKHPEFPAGQAQVRGHKEVGGNSTTCPGRQEGFAPLSVQRILFDQPDL